MSSGANCNAVEEIPRLPSGALDRSKICLKERKTYEACHGGSFMDMVKAMGESLAGGDMEAKCQVEWETYEDCQSLTVARLREMNEAANRS